MSCSDVQTIKAGNGSQLTFSFDFPYIFKSEIHVYFWNATTKEYDEKLTTDSTFPWRITDANPTIVEFTSTAPPAPTTPSDPGEPTVDNVKIRRITKVDDIRALFNPGSAIRSDDLNKNFEQLRYAIQESNCQGIPDDVDAYLKNYYWNKFDETVYSTETWDSDDDQVATTQAIDARIDSKIDSALTVDIIGADGINVQDDTPGSGQITVGLSDNSVDFDKIKDADQVKLADQEADFDLSGSDDQIFTSLAAIRRFENYVQDATPATTGIGKGAVWLDVADDKTLSMWDGSAWQAVTSGGTFSNQPKVVYVDASSGSDSNDGHRISRPKKTIKAAVEQINADATFGDGSIVSVAPGIYAETLPIDITKNDVGIIGQSLRTCIIHPKIPAADQAGYSVDVPESQELQTMFRLNSGSYISNVTLTGLKASGTRGDTGSLYTDGTHGLPPNQGFNFGFFPDAIIKKSPYIQNVTNFSDSQINNVNFTPHTPGEGAAGDLDSAPTGGGILVDGSVPNVNSPLRSMVCDSYTHTALDGPGIFVTNNGYAQCTSSYAFFNHAHITCINGGQANLAASTTDFGRFGLIADGKSSTAIFTSNVDGAAADNATSFNINAPTAASGWFGSATRPQNNMMVTVNSVTYPVLSATARTDSEGGAGWTVTISRPDPTDTSNNLGLNGAISDNDAVSFFLRSMVASSGHTMEYVGSGTNYTALPENGGVPIDANQIKELNGGKVWAATTDHKGTFKLGDFFTVDQQEGSLTVNDGSFKVNLGTLDVNVGGDAVVGADLDMGSNELTSSSGDLKLNASGNVDVQSNRIINVTDPSDAQDAATKNYVDNQIAGIDEVVEDTTPQLGGDLDVNSNSIVSTSNGDITLNPDGTGDIILDANVGIGTSSPAGGLHVDAASGVDGPVFDSGGTGNTNHALLVRDSNNNQLLRVNNNGNVGIGTSSPSRPLSVSSSQIGARFTSTSADSQIEVIDTSGTVVFGSSSGNAIVQAGGSERMQIDSSGNVQVSTGQFTVGTTASTGLQFINDGTFGTLNSIPLVFRTVSGERMRIDTSGRVLVGTSSAAKTYVSLGLQGNGASATNQATIALAKGALPSGADQELGRIEFFDNSGNSGGAIVGISDAAWTSGSSHATRLTFSTTANNASSPTERVRIDNTGFMGIGETSPADLLHIKSASGNANVRLTTGNTSSGFTGLIFGDTNDTNTGAVQYDHSNDSLQFEVNNSERMRIDSSGRLLINTTNGVELIHGVGGGLKLIRNKTGNPSSGQSLMSVGFHGVDSTNSNAAAEAKIEAFAAENHSGTTAATDLRFYTKPSGTGPGSSPTERMRITANGDIRLAMANFDNSSVDGNSTNDGIVIDKGGDIKLQVARASGTPMAVNRIGNDGNVINIRQGGLLEGSISVSSNTVSYNGGHLSRWSQLEGGAARTEILRGSVLSNLDEMCEWAHPAQDAIAAQDEVLYTEEDELPEGVSVGDVKTPAVEASPAVDAYTESNEQLNRMKVSDVEGDVNVAGVFQGWDDDDDDFTNDFYCAMTGDFVIRIAQGTTVARGDLLMSAGDGTAKPQDDDIVRSKTIAKVTSTTVSTTYTDGSYCVPCVLMAC
jgi:hypothetical protein